MYSNVWPRLILVDTQVVEGLIGVKSLGLTETHPDIIETWYNLALFIHSHVIIHGTIVSYD